MLSWIRTLWTIRNHTCRRRILWILNHKTLLPAEVPILESLGFEVFVPTKTPSDADFLSATGRHDAPSTIPAKSLLKLRSHAFYTDTWSSELINIINKEFVLVVTSVYDIPLIQVLRHFRGPIIARVFGREAQLTYTEMFQRYGCTDLIKVVSARFMLGQAYTNIAHIEDAYLRKRAQTIVCSIPNSIWKQKNIWDRKRDNLLFICPRIDVSHYYREQYGIIKKVFSSQPHCIIGAQFGHSDDKSIIGFISDHELFALYASSAAFVYISTEARHLHYSPIEAMIVGMPVLYRKGSMLSTLAGIELPGECSSLEDMQKKADRLIKGDKQLESAIISGQNRILLSFTDEAATEQWRTALAKLGLI